MKICSWVVIEQFKTCSNKRIEVKWQIYWALRCHQFSSVSSRKRFLFHSEKKNNAWKTATVYLICTIIAKSAHVFPSFVVVYIMWKNRFYPFETDNLKCERNFTRKKHLRFCFIPCEHAIEGWTPINWRKHQIPSYAWFFRIHFQNIDFYLA